MKGIILKDLLMIKNNTKALVFSIFLYMFYGLVFNLDVSFLLPLMGLMTSLSTFAYDDLSSFHIYASSFPKGRINIVKSKYIVCTLITILFLGVSLIIGLLLNTKDFSLDGTMGATCAFILIMSLVFPIMFKYGAEKGRTAMVIVGFSLAGIGLLFTKINVKLSLPLLSFLNTYGLYILVFACIIMVLISYLISKKIYLHKEF